MINFCKGIGYFFAILILSLAIGFFFFYNPFLLQKNVKPTKPLDAIVVLTGDRGRIDTATELMNKKLAKKLFISGVNKKVSLDLMKKIVHEKGINDEQVEFGYKSENTFENALEVRDFMQAFEYKSMYLVSSDYHMRRALLEFKSVMPDVKIKVYFTKTTEKKLGKFFSEYIKYIRSFVRLNLNLGEDK